MDKQDLFGRAITAIVAQGKPAIGTKPGGAGCAYRAPGGLKCAIGHLIPDELYKPEMDSSSSGTSISSVLRDFPTVANYFGVLSHSSEALFLSDLQGLHDNGASNEDVDGWAWRLPARAIRFAERYNLSYPEWLDRIEYSAEIKAFVEVKPMTDPVDQALADMHALLANKDKWSGTGGYGYYGPDSSDYGKYCIYGAAAKVTKKSPCAIHGHQGLGERIQDAALRLFSKSAVSVNDSLGYDAVIEVIKAARQAGVV